MPQDRLYVCETCGTFTKHKYIAVRNFTRSYSIYYGMKSRCLNKQHPAYKHYGGRGIKICKRWLESFDNFHEDMGTPPSKHHSLDRINNNGDYSPRNCRWATHLEQTNNSRRNVYLEYNGNRQTVSKWAKEIGIDRRLIRQRLDQGWSVEKALTTPPEKGRNQFGTDGIQYTYLGKTQSLKEWSKDTGIPVDTLRKRLNTYNWPLEKVLTKKLLYSRAKYFK